jgi:ammonium transporter, Amt family
MEDLYTINNLWMLLCTMMVFMMHLGFAALEAGTTRRKNTVNILFKNLLVPVVGFLSFTYIGFNFMYPGEQFQGAWFGFRGWEPLGSDTEHLYEDLFPFWALISFKAMFASTAATIVSGSVAERIQFRSFMLFSFFFITFCYPIVGMWLWGGGFLSTLATPFYDFSGATIVHSVGGWGALAGAILLGPRIGQYENGEGDIIQGHSMPLATLGIFLLWFGWFGFSSGSVFSAEPVMVSLVVLNTAMAGSAGALGAWLCGLYLSRKHNLPLFITGILGALVSSTAAADIIRPQQAGIIGFVAGLLVVLSIKFFDKLKVDDPVKAISAHLVCGIWGTLAVGLFGNLAGINQFISQCIGIAVIGAFSFSFSFLVFFILKKTIGIRVPAEVEKEGLDREEHGMEAYNYDKHLWES